MPAAAAPLHHLPPSTAAYDVPVPRRSSLASFKDFHEHQAESPHPRSPPPQSPSSTSGDGRQCAERRLDRLHTGGLQLLPHRWGISSSRDNRDPIDARDVSGRQPGPHRAPRWGLHAASPPPGVRQGLLPAPLKPWRRSEEDIQAVARLDGVVFIRIFVFSVRVFAVLGVGMLAPVNFLGDQLREIEFSDLSNKSIDLFSISNVKDGSNKWGI